MMRIIIPTRGRTSQQTTLQSLPGEWRRRTSIVCPQIEAFKLSFLDARIEIVSQPDPGWTIAQKRKWIMEEWLRRGYEKILMLDDDLCFATRVSESDWRLRGIRGEELGAEIQRLEDKLGSEFPHVGFGQRQGNNRLETVGWKSPARMIYSLGYYLPIFVRECELGRIETREDMDMTLQLLRKGHPNAVWHTTVNDQRRFGAPGGATNERTIERSNADAYELARLHPRYVSVVAKAYRASVPRMEVICRWQKALQDGLSNSAQKNAVC
jgi:hypothetical protein